MTEDRKRITGAPFYPLYYVSMAKTCKEHGYALTVHGSMKRDLDLVAIPWTEEASDQDVLVKALIENHQLMEGNPQGKEKPHGRKSYVFIGFGGEATGYIDLAIMPKSATHKCKMCGQPEWWYCHKGESGAIEAHPFDPQQLLPTVNCLKCGDTGLIPAVPGQPSEGTMKCGRKDA